jgi:hypothetical protein
MVNILEIVATLLLAWGVWLINRKDRRCFWFWIAGNGLSLFTHFAVGGPWFVVRDIMFLALAIDGLLRWPK